MHEHFQVQHDKIEEHQSTTTLRADRHLQKLLIWEKDSGGNLLHMDHYSTAAEWACCHLAWLDPIADSDDEDDVVALSKDELCSEVCEMPDVELTLAELLVSQPDPYCVVPLDCPGYACNLRISVMNSLFAAWTATLSVMQCWAQVCNQGPLNCSPAEADLHAWLQMLDTPAFAADLCVALLSV